MSPENIEALRAVYDRWSEGDFRSGPEIFDEHIVFVINPEFPDPGAYVGLDQIAAYMRGFLEPWIRITITAEDIAEAGDSALARVRQSGTGSGSGAMTDFVYFQVWTFRGGKVVRLENFREREDALAAVGSQNRAIPS